VAPLALQQALSGLIGEARLVVSELPGTDLKLWLIDDQNMDRAFSSEETRRILEEPPYWSFCWASGLAMARYLAERPSGCGQARASAPAPASPALPRQGRGLEVVACDLDPLALDACRANAELNVR
jgi:predicted nicotinamide N-methyase